MVCYHYQVNKTRLKNPQFCSICILRLNVINIYIYIYNIFRRYLLLCGVGACYCICIRTFLNVVFWRFPEIYWQHFHTEGRKQFCVSWPILSDQYMKTKLFNLSPLWLQDFFLIFSHSLSSEISQRWFFHKLKIRDVNFYLLATYLLRNHLSRFFFSFATLE